MHALQIMIYYFTTSYIVLPRVGLNLARVNGKGFILCFRLRNIWAVNLWPSALYFSACALLSAVTRRLSSKP